MTMLSIKPQISLEQFQTKMLCLPKEYMSDKKAKYFTWLWDNRSVLTSLCHFYAQNPHQYKTRPSLTAPL